jgi:DNA segregation ATPase FtsK/SpoIIIE-like protein
VPVAKRKGRTKRESREATAAGRSLAPRGRAVLRQLSLLVGIFASIYVLAALATYDPTDPSFTHFGHERGAQRRRPIGAWIADALFQTFGVAAWATTILTLFLSWRLAGRSGPSLRVELAWACSSGRSCASSGSWNP